MTDLATDAIQLTDEEKKQYISGADDLKKVLSDRDDAEQVLLDAIGRTVTEKPTSDTLNEGAERLRSLVGPNATTLIVWTFATNTDERLAWVDENCNSSAVAFLRRLGALYGPELRHTYSVWNELPDTWSNVFREVFFDFVTQQHRVRLRIRKYSGDEVIIEGPPDSILDLTTHMLLTLNYLPSKDVFRESLVESFLAPAHAFIEKLTAVPEEAPVLESATPTS